MFNYTIISNNEFKIENKEQDFLLFYIGDETLAISETDKMNVEEVENNKLSKIKELNTKYQENYNLYLSNYPQAEIDTFNDKKKEALAYQLDNTVQTPIIDAIVATLGGTKDDYILSVLSKVESIANNEGNLVKTRDAIKACTTQEDLDSIII